MLSRVKETSKNKEKKQKSDTQSHIKRQANKHVDREASSDKEQYKQRKYNIQICLEQ